jgi:hypothetical protein
MGFVVGPRALTTNHTGARAMLAPGQPIYPTDFYESDVARGRRKLLELEVKGLVVRRQPDPA